MLRTYTLSPATIRRFLRRTFWRFQLIAGLSFLGFALYLAFLAGEVDWRAAGPILGIIALVYFYVIFVNFRQQLRTLYSVRYEIDDSTVIYRQASKPPLRILRASITGAQQRRDGIWIETSRADSGLFIPFGLTREGDEDFQGTLSTWTTVLPAPVSTQRGTEFWLGLAGLGAVFLLLVFVNQLAILLPLGLVVLAAAWYAQRLLTRVAPAPPAILRIYRLAFGFLILVVLSKSIFLALAR